jgi:3-phenylpropionate/cinnamic acid dioxygenase small subunit
MVGGFNDSGERLKSIEQFLYREARLLDERRFREWLDLLTDDIHYWLPVRSVIKADHPKKEFTSKKELGLFDEDKASLRMRVEKLETLMAWSEDPPSRTCRFINNIEVMPSEVESEYRVYSKLLIYRTRMENTQDFFAGSREDVLRLEGSSWKLAGRTIYLAQTNILSDNVSIFL